MLPLTNAPADPALWRLAKARAGFKVHAFVYLCVNAGLWLLYAFTTPGSYPWPAWTSFGWGIGLFFSYLAAYRPFGTPRIFDPQAEYERLMRQ